MHARANGAASRNKKPVMDPKVLDNEAEILEHVQKYSFADDSQAWAVVAVSVALLYGTLALFYALPFVAGVLATVLPAAIASSITYSAYSVLRGFVLVRWFMFFHDLTHMSFFASPSMNSFIGILAGAPIGTPYKFWRDGHLHHHQHLGNKDVEDRSRTIFHTTDEWARMPLAKKLAWRVLREPFIFFLTVPFLMFAVEYRFRLGARFSERPFLCTFHTMYIIAYITAVQWFDPALMRAELIGMVLATTTGVLLFHYQHSVNMGYWKRGEDFDRNAGAIKGSTFLRVPWMLKWMSLGIEYHHVHHLRATVPCYKLEQCHRDGLRKGLWKDVNYVDYNKAFVSFFHTLYDEKAGRYVAFEPYNTLLRAAGLTDDYVSKCPQNAS